MILRTIALAAIAATSIGAQAALTTYAPWDAVDGGGTGLAGVQFNVVSANGVTVALGAHAYKNGVLLPNNGVDTYYAQSGIYVPDGKGRANWSFDTMYSLGNCTSCSVWLGIDKDPTAAVNMVVGNISAYPTNPESWNMEWASITASVYDFNPFGASSTAFSLEIRDAAGDTLAKSDITVNVPEPGSLALAGIALAGLAGLRRRKA